jgi:hypothetical protein
MHRRQTFLLTLISPETGDAAVRGRLKAISSGKFSNFTSIEELYQLLTEESECSEQSLDKSPADECGKPCGSAAKV